MKIIRSLFLSFLLILVLLLSGCSSDEKLLADSDDYAFLDHQPAAAIITHSYEKFIKNSFSVLASFFSKSDASGIKNKLFGNIKNQLKIDLLNAEPLHIDKLAHKCNVKVWRLSTILLEMELKGLVEKQPGNIYSRLY